MNDQDTMPFGVHAGKKMEDVPAPYLLWLWNEGCRNQSVMGYVRDNLSALEKEAPDVIVRRTD